MDGLQSAGAVAVSLKPLIDLAKALADAAGSSKLRQQAVELYREILAAQESALAANAAQAALIEEKRRLEEELAELEAWAGEAEQYRLAEVGRGTFAYAQKPDAEAGEPFHLLCAHCYQSRRKSILQRHPRTVMGHWAYDCPLCRTQIGVEVGRLKALGAAE